MTAIEDAYVALLTSCEDHATTEREDTIDTLGEILYELHRDDLTKLLGLVAYDLVIAIHAVGLTVPAFVELKKKARR